jgi:hypothetical protein
MELMHQNKWQNGLTTHQEGCVYAIPLAGETVLRIRTGRPIGDAGRDPSEAEDVEVTTWKLPLPNKTLEKWEGGVLAKNGVMYCMPNNHKAVLQIVPACVPSRDDLAKKRELLQHQRDEEREALRMKLEEERKRKQAEKEAKRLDRKSRTNNSTNGNGCTPQNSKAPGTSTATRTSSETTDEGLHFMYTTGIPTLRSSAHRVKYSLEHRKHDPNPIIDGKSTNSTFLPADLCKEDIFSYNTQAYNFHNAIVKMLESCDSELIGSFRTLNGDRDSGPLKLDNFTVPVKSLTRQCQKGQLEDAQKYLSEQLESNSDFLTLFDRFLENVILPHLKQRLVKSGVASDDKPITFYFQRPPTLRIQPGPARAIVRA